MTNNYQYSIELLIAYYQDLIDMNDRFNRLNKLNTDINTGNDENDKYKNLVNKLIAIRQLIIDKKVADISTLYKPAPGLFINKEHFTTLEAAIQFYKDNPGVDYDIAGAEQYYNDYAATNNDLVNKLIAIRQLIIDKKVADISTLYKPAPGLFINKEHFTTLEAAIQFYKDNPGVDYDIAGAEQYYNDYAATNNDSVNNELRLNEQTTNNTIQALSILGDEIKTQLFEIQEPIKKLANDDICSQIIKSSNDTLAALSTNHELMKSDVRKYDTFLTEHISKSGIHVTEAIEKEHARFVQRMASDSNAIIASISETVASEVAIQTNQVKDSMKALDDKLFKWVCIVFIVGICALFACSILSSSWAANKLLNGIKGIAATVQHNNLAPIPKKRH